MPDEDDQNDNLATMAAAALVAISSGIAIRVNELLALADAWGRITIPVSSSCIGELNYNIATGTMGVVFTDGSTYDYPNTSIASVVQFVNADSKGRYFNENFRGQAATQFAGSKKQRIRLGR